MHLYNSLEGNPGFHKAPTYHSDSMLMAIELHPQNVQ